MLDSINWTAVSFAMSAASMLASAAAWVFVQMTRKHAATDAQVRALDNRLTAVETTIGVLPSGKAWADLRENIAGIRGDVKTSAEAVRGLGAGLKRVEHQIGLLMEHELRGAGEKR